MDKDKLDTWFRHISYFYERKMDNLDSKNLVNCLSKPNMQISIYKLLKTLIRFENIDSDLYLDEDND